VTPTRRLGILPGDGVKCLGTFACRVDGGEDIVEVDSAEVGTALPDTYQPA